MISDDGGRLIALPPWTIARVERDAEELTRVSPHEAKQEEGDVTMRTKKADQIQAVKGREKGRSERRERKREIYVREGEEDIQERPRTPAICHGDLT